MNKEEKSNRSQRVAEILQVIKQTKQLYENIRAQVQDSEIFGSLKSALAKYYISQLDGESWPHPSDIITAYRKLVTFELPMPDNSDVTILSFAIKNIEAEHSESISLKFERYLSQCNEYCLLQSKVSNLVRSLRAQESFIVFCDMKESTPISRYLPDAWNTYLVFDYGERIQRHAEKFCGTPLNSYGDGLLFSFDSALSACGFSQEVMIDLVSNENAVFGFLPFAHISIAQGTYLYFPLQGRYRDELSSATDVQEGYVSAGDQAGHDSSNNQESCSGEPDQLVDMTDRYCYVGKSINFASRICDEAVFSQVLIDEKTRAAIQHEKKAQPDQGFGVAPAKKYTLRDFGETQLYSLSWWEHRNLVLCIDVSNSSALSAAELRTLIRSLEARLSKHVSEILNPILASGDQVFLHFSDLDATIANALNAKDEISQAIAKRYPEASSSCIDPSSPAIRWSLSYGPVVSRNGKQAGIPYILSRFCALRRFKSSPEPSSTFVPEVQQEEIIFVSLEKGDAIPDSIARELTRIEGCHSFVGIGKAHFWKPRLAEETPDSDTQPLAEIESLPLHTEPENKKESKLPGRKLSPLFAAASIVGLTVAIIILLVALGLKDKETIKDEPPIVPTPASSVTTTETPALPLPPTHPVIALSSDQSKDGVQLSWQEPATDQAIAYYEIRMSPGGPVVYTPVGGGDRHAFLDDQPLVNGERRRYEVLAFSANEMLIAKSHVHELVVNSRTSEDIK
jgi:class 3 adenylate cyclase